jgi:hypothetical protein
MAWDVSANPGYFGANFYPLDKQIFIWERKQQSRSATSSENYRVILGSKTLHYFRTLRTLYTSISDVPNLKFSLMYMTPKRFHSRKKLCIIRLSRTHCSSDKRLFLSKRNFGAFLDGERSAAHDHEVPRDDQTRYLSLAILRLSNLGPRIPCARPFLSASRRRRLSPATEAHAACPCGQLRAQ